MAIPALALAVALALATTDVPVPPQELPLRQPPELSSPAYILYDVDNDVVLLRRNGEEQRAIASVTKLVTALVALERSPLDEPVVISESAAGTGEAEVGLVAGEVWTVYELVAAIVVRSGNDAATALAEHLGGSVEGFAVLMDGKAADLGMVDSDFANPHGLDEEGHYSTADDLLILTRAALDNPVINRLARTKVMRFRRAPDGSARFAHNTNVLLGAYEGVQGLKTGFTSQAGRVLVSMSERDGRRFIAVVMGSEDHFEDTRLLYEYAYATAGPADRLRRGLAMEEGGGGPATAAVATWLQPRLATMHLLSDGDPDGPRPMTPTEQAVVDRLNAMVPALLRSSP